ncbi:hypothetical protein HC928_14735 [bacterium]|nr:hypothetical protein [bacterium]
MNTAGPRAGALAAFMRHEGIMFAGIGAWQSRLGDERQCDQKLSMAASTMPQSTPRRAWRIQGAGLLLEFGVVGRYQ